MAEIKGFLDHFSFEELLSAVTTIQALIGLIISAVSLASAYFLWNKKNQKFKYSKVHFPEDTDSFYIYFSNMLSQAKTSIRNVGDGFTLTNDDSLKRANTLDYAIVKALENGVDVKRFQLLSATPISWFSRLRAIKEKYPQNFHVYCNSNYDGIGSFCIVDAGERKTVFQQQSLSGVIVGRGTKSVDYMFVHGHQSKSGRASQLFDDAIRDMDTLDLTIEDLKRMQIEEWDRRIKRAINDKNFTPIDPEIIDSLRHHEDKTARFPSEKFNNIFYTALNFENRLKE